jgi:gluconate 2-dehydrogenase gamma chain
MTGNPHPVSRRAVLQAVATALGVAALPVDWQEVLEGASDTFLTPAEAADVEAIAAQIVPTDDTPGAREAGVVHFIDRALATFFAQIAPDYRRQLAGFQEACRAQHPEAASFASLTSDQQIAFLKTVDRTTFFTTTCLLTMFGMFVRPEYGGNRDGVGWALIGFEDRHMFQPPFGYYDRDYPGFSPESGPTK